MSEDEAKQRGAMAVRLIRFIPGWGQETLAKEMGIDPKEVWAWENFWYAPSRPNLQRAAAAVGVPLGLIEILVPILLWLQRRARGRRRVPAWRIKDEQRRPVGTAWDGVSAEVIWMARELPPLHRWDSPEEDDAARSEIFVERLCEDSERVAADDPARALGLARAAWLMARHARPEDRPRLEGHAGAFEANALRVGSDLDGAEAAFGKARALRLAGAAGTGRLDPSRPLDLEASLRRAQGRFPEALKLLDEALAICRSPEAQGRILLKKGSVLEQMGDSPKAINALRQAARLIDEEREPRQMFAAQFNLGVNLCHLGKFGDASELVNPLRLLAAELESRSDRVRVRWLESRILAGQGDLENAVITLDRVRSEFEDLGYRYDEAIATLELARLYLRQGRTDKTQELAARAEPVFRELNVAPRVLESVLVFLEAARQEAATLELLDQALQALGEGRRGR
ncbi:MAG TPA: tetratricopeptide repeat protein [Thermoanaerobaculia bacterium]|nr:tetratricopeptide repeat protein [Thermoanaerobaculia bacterium]